MKINVKVKKFTLIELIIVIVAIGMLSGMALPKFIGVERNAKVSAMDQDLDVLEKVVNIYVSNNDGNYPFVGDKVSITTQTLKDTLDTIGDDGSQVYTLDMTKLKPYLQNLKFNNESYCYSRQSNTAIDPTGKVDGNGITHYILDGGVSNNTSTTSIKSNISIKKQIGNYVLFSDGELANAVTGKILRKNVKDFYYSPNSYQALLYVTNDNNISILYSDSYELNKTIINGVIDKVCISSDSEIIVTNTNGDIFYCYDCYNGDDFIKVEGVTGTINNVFNDTEYTTITNTNGDVFYSCYGYVYPKLVGVTGTIDKVYSNGFFTTILNHSTLKYGEFS